jgi:hypothetical protein
VTQKRELLKCVVAAMYSWQHCGTGTLSYRQTRHSVIMDQWNGQQRASPLKKFEKDNGRLACVRKEFRRFFLFRASWSRSLETRGKNLD